jgi:hypothetical protein
VEKDRGGDDDRGAGRVGEVAGRVGGCVSFIFVAFLFLFCFS